MSNRTLADDPDVTTDWEIADRWGGRLLLETCLDGEGLLLLTSGDGVHLSIEQLRELAIKILGWNYDPEATNT
ncbi:hypothetical protein [Streptomyces hoynatensis]|uniref:Uncharacterized protein n=1 Tax=Streptomyces hoynatensis TaxID=1141874 RepID=A0A3A9YGN4_9ACTN|nr:hypothetical protein [Streptomyces hoynatensis]RKN35973.1 hypothetical protein D7294_30550 [Streptomyces hoynatensis]